MIHNTQNLHLLLELIYIAFTNVILFAFENKTASLFSFQGYDQLRLIFLTYRQKVSRKKLQSNLSTFSLTFISN